MTTARQSTLIGRLARGGFTDPERAGHLLADPAMAGLFDGEGAGHLLDAVSDAPDPDLALMALVRLMTAAGAVVGDVADELRALLREPGEARARLVAVLGNSVALGDHLARHPGHWRVLAEDPPLPADGTGETTEEAELRAELLGAVAADPDAERPRAALPTAHAYDALRVAYRRRLLAIAGRDLVSPDPLAVVPVVARELAHLAGAALEAALAVARATLPDAVQDCRIAVIGMGKCGGLELNYVSDVDVIYVVEPLPGDSERLALVSGTRLATGLARACSTVTAEGTLWPVDAALRPEGRFGPLVRTLASHLAYYERWAATWEFQALLKARVVAGDRALGEAYLAAVQPLVWKAAERENFVPDVQAMRRRVEQHVLARDADRQLKLGRGGLRDVEFSVQLLQLVHGRVDRRLQTGNTLLGLEALSTFGYVGRGDAADLDRAYRMLRALEHRLQLYRLQRTHVVPDHPQDLRRIGRSFGFRKNPAEELTQLWRRHALEVRRLHEKLFYRPLLVAAARLTTDEARLTPEAAKARLAALGYRDPAGAMRHITALTEGVSRRAAIQRQLLPVMLEWFADGADPDAGLLAFRRLSDALGSTHWYLKMLRDSGAAAERLSLVLSSSRLVADLLQKGPEAVALLEGDDVLTPRDRDSIRQSMRLAAARHEEAEAAATAVRAVRRREIVRTAVADIVGLADLDTVGRALSDAAIGAIEGALAAASTAVATSPLGAKYGGQVPTRLLIVAMGRLGGAEQSYGSDADVLFVHDPLPGAGDQDAQQAAMSVITELRRLLVVTGAEPPLELDANLRPEGRNGPLVRSLNSYAEYYARWAVPWEAQALIRARPVVGDAELGERFATLVDPVRWPEAGLPESAVREIRRIKARVESERLPRGADPLRHLKLGRGGLADVEWTVQLLQLRHAYDVPALRTTSTLPALSAAAAAGVIDQADAEVLADAWRLAASLRNAAALWRGRGSDMLPRYLRDLDGVARLIGYAPASAGRLEEDYLRTTRRARAVVERLFYG